MSVPATRSRPPACEGCPANATASGFVPPTGPNDARLAIVGQGPGADEAALSEPFVGPSGRHLNRWLARAGVPRERCAVSNIVWCHLPKNRKPTTREITHCWDAHVGPHLRSLPNLRVVVAVGVPAAKHFVPHASAKTAGTVERYALDERTVWVVPTIHPAAIIKGAWANDPAQPRYIRRAWEIATADAPYLPDDVTVAPLGGVIAKTPADVATFLGELLADPPTFVYTDIEGTGGVLIGIGFWVLADAARPARGMYVPFRSFAAPYWSEDDTAIVAEWVNRVLASPDVPKVLHNGASFDIPFLEDIGFVVNGYVDDTMVRAWATYHEMPKSLQELAILYCGFPAWKHTSHTDDEGDGK